VDNSSNLCLKTSLPCEANENVSVEIPVDLKISRNQPSKYPKWKTLSTVQISDLGLLIADLIFQN